MNHFCFFIITAAAKGWVVTNMQVVHIWMRHRQSTMKYMRESKPDGGASNPWQVLEQRRGLTGSAPLIRMAKSRRFMVFGIHQNL